MVSGDSNPLGRVDIYSHVATNAAEAVELPRLLLARCVWLLHLCVSLFICGGWALPWSWAPWITLFLTGVALFSWRVNNDRCPLTVLEEKLRGPTARSTDENEPVNFIVDSLSHVLGRALPYDLVNRGIRIVTWFALSMAALRLALGGW